MYWMNAQECRHYMRAFKHHRMADDCISGSPEGDHSAESTVNMIDCDVSYLEDAPEEELKRQSDRISRINERLSELRNKLHQE